MKAKRVDLTVSISVSVFAPLDASDERIRELVASYVELVVGADVLPLGGLEFPLYIDVEDTEEDQDTDWLDMTDALCLSDDREELLESSECNWWRDGKK